MTQTEQSNFLEAACVPLDADHGSGDLVRAEKILAGSPGVGAASIYTAAALGDDATVRAFIEQDSSLATAKGGSRSWDALTYLCFSKFLKLDKSRSDGFVRAATVLLDAGASANTGWFEAGHQPNPIFESVMYGAAGVAHSPALTRLLLERGGDPNDDETPYHTPETYDNSVLEVILESGKFNADSLATVLLRKTDWHDYEGIKLVLERGVDPDRVTQWRKTALQNAIISDNRLEIIELLLDHGANPLLKTERPHRNQLPVDPQSTVEMAARRGRGDVLRLFRSRGISIDLTGIASLIGECALGDKNGIATTVTADPTLKAKVIGEAGRLLCEFAGNDNAQGIESLLDLGVPIDARSKEGDGYFGVARNSSALHVASWRAAHGTVKLLLSRGTTVDAKDGQGRTPLQLAIKACVDSFWTERRNTQSIEALLDAGASTEGMPEHTGYDEADALIAAANAKRRRG